jgi:hypothetical protein
MAYIRKTKDVHISPKLLDVLNKIAPKSEIAKKLLRTKISKDDLVDEPVDYLTISKKDPSKISYAYPEKLEKIENPEEYWTFKGRVEAKPASAIKKVLKDVTEKELDLFTSLYKAATANKEFDFQIVTGEDITKYYHENTYTRDGYGSLTASCMKYNHCSPYFSIYALNPEVCQMLLMFDNKGSLLGRALLWNTVDTETGKEVKAMDRIYCINDDKNIHYFKEWADENGYVARKNQKWFDCLRFESHGNETKLKLSIKIKDTEYKYFPYVDTFKFWDIKNGILSNFLPADTTYIKVLADNNGKYHSSNYLLFDDYMEVYEQSGRMVILDYPVSGRRFATLRENCEYSDFQGLYVLRDHCEWNDELRDYILKGDFAQYNDQELLEERKNYLKNNGIGDFRLKLKKNRFTEDQFQPVFADDDYDDFDDELLDEDDNDEVVVRPQPIDRPIAAGEIQAALNRLNDLANDFIF